MNETLSELHFENPGITLAASTKPWEIFVWATGAIVGTKYLTAKAKMNKRRD